MQRSREPNAAYHGLIQQPKNTRHFARFNRNVGLGQVRDTPLGLFAVIRGEKVAVRRVVRDFKVFDRRLALSSHVNHVDVSVEVLSARS